ncbi:hypothetical protein [Paludifilum halophilum]|uniref:NEAT domain-containing protein n=1 Tax=Paludifilum halophilum TaxID=1642702 RepID=A0A235B794_9BACL|nr:hypothetical protein [Paludifilum halophilum]OYD08166.1 hypothetical protein CHM34_08655 [Paludifilum halophilum]
MRTAAVTVLMCLLMFTVAPAASFAETFQDTASQNLQGSYFTQDGQHHIELQLPHADQPQGKWIVTLNGSYEQTSPEAAQMGQFSVNYDDLVDGRNYQVIAVFYGKNGDQPVDLNNCFQFEAKKPTSELDNQVKLQRCGFAEKAVSSEKSDSSSSVDEAIHPDGDDSQSDREETGKTPENEESQTGDGITDKEEAGSLQNLDSSQSKSEEGGELPETASPSTSHAWIGLQLFLLGCALLGFHPALTQQKS